MGLSLTKSPLERRNTVARRSQRRSIHTVKAKVASITKDIKKFKGTSEDVAFNELRQRIESAGKELQAKSKDLQPQLRNIHGETKKLLEDCSLLLVDKLKENQEKDRVNKEAELEKKNADLQKQDSVIVEEVEEEENEERKDLEDDRRRTVELKVMQIDAPELTSRESMRKSVVRMGGVAVMPGSILKEMHSQEGEIQDVQRELERLEVKISEFVGKKHGKHYVQLKEQLEDNARKLTSIDSGDEAVLEKIKRCLDYVDSCLSFLDEKALDGDDDVFPAVIPTDEANNNHQKYSSPLTPRSPRTTQI